MVSDPVLPSKFYLTVCGSSNIGIHKSTGSDIELQVGVPYAFDFLNRYSNSHNDEFVLVDLVINVNFDLPFGFDLIACRSSIFGVGENCW